MARDELKINIIIKGDRIFLGAQANDCDPKMTTLQGGLQAALERIPAFVEEANRQWDAAPRNPKTPEPPPAPKVVSQTKPGSKTTPSKAATPATPAVTQQKFF